MKIKLTTQHILGAVIVLALIGLVISMTMGKKKEERVIEEDFTVTKQGKAAAIDEESTEADATVIEQQLELAKKAWGRDPFTLAKRKRIYKGGAVVFKGLSVGKDKKAYAFINDSIVTVGDSVDGYKVLEIQRDKILLNKGSNSFYLSLPQE